MLYLNGLSFLIYLNNSKLNIDKKIIPLVSVLYIFNSFLLSNLSTYGHLNSMFLLPLMFLFIKKNSFEKYIKNIFFI